MDLTRRHIFAAAALPLLAAFDAPDYDVPFVPTPHALVEKMLDLARIGASDYLIDLGCGDGRIAVAAARRGARALGVDLDPLRIEEARAAARIAGLEARVRFRRQDLFATPIWDADVIALYLLPRINLALRPRLLTELRPGARIVSHAFDMGDWRPEAAETHDGRRIFLWLVPAVAGGRWTMTEADGTIWALELEQRFQDVTGTMSGGGRVLALEGGVLRGTSFRFTAGGRAFAGTIADAAIAGADSGWRAVRLD
ncbi:MAG TPA: methyltransferase domain-containing protein [Allosphingosinicella sp.]|nr:methyltransferase domain-containing protein [Allosphingosinicella sp.]